LDERSVFSFVARNRLVREIGVGLILLLLGGCGFPLPTPTASIATVSATVPPSAPLTPLPLPPTPTPPIATLELVATPTTVATPYPQPDLSERPLVFFGPLPEPDGSLDFMDLFAEGAPWTQAAQHVQIFNLFGGWVAHFPWEPPEATDDELLQIIADLNRRAIAIGFEASPLVATDECGQGIEGFFGPEEGLRIVTRLKQLGATVRYVSLDEPFAFGHIYEGPQACHWSPEQIAQQVQDYIAAIKTVYPDAIIGDNEPLWAGVDVGELVDWLDAYQAVTGSPLPFIHLDLDFSRPDWPTAAKVLEAAARARGIEFGIFYLGDPGDATDAEWLNKAFERARVYELIAGGKPDHVQFESWHDRPDYLLPETNPDTFTALLDRYFRTRTAFSLSLGPLAADGTQGATGTLADDTGAPLAGAVVELTMQALDGPGLVAEYTLTGTVPAGAVRSDVGFRVNTECGCQGTSNFILYEVRYCEDQETASRVPNGVFTSGLEGWGSWGSGTIQLQPGDRDGGRMLHVRATLDQDAAINSAPFPVTPGATYTLTFLARISPASLGSGYFDITFQDAQAEFTRETIQLAPAIVQLAAAPTDAQGRYAIRLESLPPGNLQLEANYAGSDRVWPAYASIVLSHP
jgi:hypothetical protein